MAIVNQSRFPRSGFCVNYFRIEVLRYLLRACSLRPAEGFGLVIIKMPKTKIIISLWSSYYMPQNIQNSISQTALKHYNEFRSVITESLR